MSKQIESYQLNKRQKSSDSLNTIQRNEELPIKKRRGSNRIIAVPATEDAVYYDSSAQTLAVALADLQERFTKTHNEVIHLRKREHDRYEYNISLRFNEYFDPMNPDHMTWFRKFSRQTMYKKSMEQIIDEYAIPEPDHYINNPFGIPITLEERRNRPRTFYILCAKITMDNLNIPMGPEFFPGKQFTYSKDSPIH